MVVNYEASFGFVERPFSLTPDPKYFFKSRSHGRAIETLTFGLRRRERFLLVTGDLGVGKTVLCRTLLGQIRRRGPVSFIRNPLLTPAGLFRLLLEDFAALSDNEGGLERMNEASPAELGELLAGFVRGLAPTRETGIIVVDEAHALPPVMVEQILSLAALEPEGEPVLQFVLIGQSAAGESGALGIRALDERVTTNARLLPLGRDECADYVAHRLSVAGAGATRLFSSKAIDALYAISGGTPRLVNLLCERALQEAAARGARTVEPQMIDAAVSDLDLLRARPRRFRWFSKRVS